MAAAAPKLTYTFAEYLALEAKSEAKHEYVNGEIFAMGAGDSVRLASVGITVSVDALYANPLEDA